MKPRAALVIALALALAPRSARADVFTVLGAGPEGVAELNARAARVEDAYAGVLNPGGLGLGKGARVGFAAYLGGSALTAAGKRQPLEDPFGVALTFDATIPFEGPLRDRIRVGFAGYLPPRNALHLRTHEGAGALFPYYDNRTQRLVLVPSLAVRILDGLAVGASLDVLGGVSGPASVVDGLSGAPEPRLDLQAKTAVSVRAGLRFDPRPGVRLALSVRQRFAAPAVVDTTAAVAGIPLSISVATHAALFDPTTITAAGSFDVGRASFEIDASYSVWSAYEGPWVRVHATLPGVDVSSVLPEAPARDVVSLRAAGSYRIDLLSQSSLVLRAGLGLEPSMLKSDQQGITNLVDGAKVMGGIGLTFTLQGVLPVAVQVSAGGNVQGVLPYSQAKRACVAAPCGPDTVSGPDAANPSQGITNPGYPTLTGGGVFWSTAFGLGVML